MLWLIDGGAQFCSHTWLLATHCCGVFGIQTFQSPINRAIIFVVFVPLWNSPIFPLLNLILTCFNFTFNSVWCSKMDRLRVWIRANHTAICGLTLWVGRMEFLSYRINLSDAEYCRKIASSIPDIHCLCSLGGRDRITLICWSEWPSQSWDTIWQNVCGHLTITPLCWPFPNCCLKAESSKSDPISLNRIHNYKSRLLS